MKGGFTTENRRSRRGKCTGLLLCVLCASIVSTPAQNIVADGTSGRTAAPITVTEEQVLSIVNRIPEFHLVTAHAEARRVADKLNRHVTEFLEGVPWMPFHHTLGISGYEAYFNHPDELFYALSVALPLLPKDTAARTKVFLAGTLARTPPYGADGFDHRRGRRRESYDVPNELRLTGAGKATSALGVYAFWAYVHYTKDSGAAKAHWDAVRERVQPLLESEYHFDITRKNHHRDEAETLNGDLAGLIGFIRLARINGDSNAEQKALSRAGQLLESRVNLERVNPKILEPTRATKSLHISKLARFVDLTPEIGEAVRTMTDGCGAAHLKAFREARNAWHLAFGDRLIGGENYTNPLHFPRALFAGAVFVEQLPAEEMWSFIDVPWGKGDFYFVEKCAWALWAGSGRRWAFSGNEGTAAGN